MQAKAFYLDQEGGYAKKRPNDNDSWPILFWPSVSFLSVSHNGRVAWTELRSPTQRSSVDDVRARVAGRAPSRNGRNVSGGRDVVGSWRWCWTAGAQALLRGVGGGGLWSVDRPVGTLASPAPLPLPQRTLLRSFRQGYVRVAGIEDGTARGPPVFGVWGGAWGAVGRGHMAAGPACRYLFQTAWSKES